MATSYLESLLGEREKIILTARQHWFILIGSIALEIILILLIFAATITAAVFFPPYLALIIAIGFAVLLIPIFTMTMDILKYTHQQYVITNRRVMQISGVFNKSVTDSNLEKVNDIHMAQSALGRVFDYGDIEILTASELGINLFKRIESPVRFKKALLDAKSELEGYDHVEDLLEAAATAPAPAAETTGVPALISQLDNLRQQGLLSEEEFQQKKAQLLDRI
jgi:uncharacterized membrane protein YdbT with pleckstrin-like domain